jgi:hypothetical protein
MKKRYYLIEPLDIDGDKNPDGFLVSQYRIDKNGNNIFLKNKYITYKKLKIYADKVAKIQKGGKISNNILPNQQQIPNNMIVLTPAEYNQMRNQQNNGNHPSPNNQPTPPFVYKDETGFYNNFKNSAGSAAGTGLVYSMFGWANLGIASSFIGD